VRDAVLAAELDHGRGSGNTEARLQRARLVVDARVDKAAVVAALVAGNAVFFLQDQKPQAWEAACDFESNGKAYDAAADDDYVVARVGHSR